MSLVIAAITANNDIVICADSRIVDENDNIISENENKIYQVSDKCAIGYTGYKNAFDCLKVYLELESIFLDINNVDSIYNEVLEYMDKNKSDLHLIVTGFDKENNPKLYVIVSNENKISPHDLSNVKYMGIGDYNFNLNVNINNDVNKIIYELKQTIQERSKVNKTINNIMNCIVLTR